MDKCKDCTCGGNVVTPTIVLNITFNDNRMDEDASNYVEHLLMDDGCGGCEETDE